MFFGGYFTADINQVFALLKNNLSNSEKKSRLCGIVFAHEDNEYSKSKLIPMIDYWNYRSKEFVDFFFLGYLGDDNQGDSEFSPILPDDKFDNKAFVEAIEYFESNCKWKYSGQPTMLLCRGYLTDKWQSNLDLKSVIEIDFIQAEKEELISSAESIFESIIRATKENAFSAIDFDFLKNIYGKPLAKSLIRTILENLPIDVSRLFNTATALKIISSSWEQVLLPLIE